MTELVPEQIQDMPWATHDDLMDAIEDVEAWGFCCARLVDDDGDLRLKRIAPKPEEATYVKEAR